MKKFSFIFLTVIGTITLQTYFASQCSAQEKSSNKKLADTAFASKIAYANTGEIAFAKMAIAQSSSKQIRDFANMMITDHTKANTELFDIAKAKNMILPTGMGADDIEESSQLGKLNDKNFNIAYVKAMIDGHKKVLKMMKDEAASGTDADLKAFAAKTAPVVEHHLAEIKKIKAGMK